MNNMDSNTKITKRPFITKLAEKKEYSPKEASDIYELFIDTLVSEVLKGNEVMLTGFGSFSLKCHKGHPIKFIKKEKSQINEYLVLKFTASNTLSKKLRKCENNKILIAKIKEKADKNNKE